MAFPPLPLRRLVPLLPLLPLLYGLLAMAWIPPAAAQDAALNRRDAASLDLLEDLPPAVSAAASRASGSMGGRDDTDLYGEQEILTRPGRWQPWSVSASLSGEWQSNAPLSAENETQDYVWRQSISVRNTWKLSESWYLNAGAAEQTSRYDRFDVLDFDRLDGDAGVLWITQPDWHPLLANWVLGTGASWSRLSEASRFSNALLTNTAITGALARSFILHPHHSLLVSFTSEVSVDASDPLAQRDEYAAQLAWRAQWSPRWETTAQARLAYYDYEQHADWNWIGSLGVDYLIGRDFRIGLNANWTDNQSDSAVFNYQNASLGASFRLQFRF